MCAWQVRDLEGQLADSKHGHEQLISRAKAVEQEHLSEGGFVEFNQA